MPEERKRAPKSAAEVSRTRRVERIQVGPYRQTIVFTGRSPSPEQLESETVSKYTSGSGSDVGPTKNGGHRVI